MGGGVEAVRGGGALYLSIPPVMIDGGVGSRTGDGVEA